LLRTPLAHTDAMTAIPIISDDLARRLRDAGLTWHPASGDRFRIEAELLSDSIFTLSDMTIEAHQFGSGTVLGFNGTTEWALDSVAVEDALWLPREDQLRALLGGTFRSLAADDRGFHVHIVQPDGVARTFTAAQASDAYGLALLDLISLARA
jgi:hypothetical protein